MFTKSCKVGQSTASLAKLDRLTQNSAGILQLAQDPTDTLFIHRPINSQDFAEGSVESHTCLIGLNEIHTCLIGLNWRRPTAKESNWWVDVWCCCSRWNLFDRYRNHAGGIWSQSSTLKGNRGRIERDQIKRIKSAGGSRECAATSVQGNSIL